MPSASPRRRVNQFVITNAPGTRLPAEIPAPSSRYAANIGANEFIWLTRRYATPEAIAPQTMTKRASTRSTSIPNSGEPSPNVIASMLGSIETRARLHPKCLIRAGMKTVVVSYPPPTRSSTVMNRLATINQPWRSWFVMKCAPRYKMKLTVALGSSTSRSRIAVRDRILSSPPVRRKTYW